MNDLQCPECKSNRVTVAGSHIACLGCGHREYLYDYRNAYDEPVACTEEDPEVAELRERIDNLEAVSAQKGSAPRQYHDQLQQLRGEVANLRHKVVGQPSPRAATAQSAQPTYQDIRV